MRLPAVLALVAWACADFAAAADVPRGMRLRGGGDSRGSSEARRSSIRVIPKSAVQTSSGAEKETFRLAWKAKGNEKSVQVVGSWSKFKERTDLRQAQSGGEWLVDLELPIGQHELKFVINGQEWCCSNDLPTKTDNRGMTNNAIEVKRNKAPSQVHRVSLAQTPAPTPPPPAYNDVVKEKEDEGEAVYVSHKSTITEYQGLVEQMERERILAQQRLQKAHAQLVDTMLVDLDQGLKTLEQSKSSVGSFASMGLRGREDMIQNAEAKVSQIKTQAAALREVLERKEAHAVQAVEQACKNRVALLDTQLHVYNQTLPEINSLIESVSEAIRDAPTAPDKFVSVAQILLGELGRVSEQACQLKQPSIDANFDAIKAESDAQMQNVLKSSSGQILRSASQAQAHGSMPVAQTGV